MARKDTEETEGLRDIFDFRKRYDIILAGDYEIEKEKSKKRLDLYENIKEKIEKVSKRAYIPNKDLEESWSPDKTYIVLNNIIIPTSDLVLSYLGLTSIATCIMTSHAAKNNIPIAYLYEKQDDLDRFALKTTTMRYENKKEKITNTRDYAKDVEIATLKIERNDLRNLEAFLEDLYDKG